MFARSHYDECLRAALANPIYALEESHSALSMLWKGVVAFRSLAGVSAWLQDNIPALGIRQAKVDQSMTEEEWLRYQKDLIYIFRLSGTNQEGDEVDHVVAYDAGRGVFFYCVERFALRFSSRIFDLCIGDDSQFLGISEMRLIYAQEVGNKAAAGKKKNPNKRISYSLKRERRRSKNKEEDNYVHRNRG